MDVSASVVGVGVSMRLVAIAVAAVAVVGGCSRQDAITTANKTITVAAPDAPGASIVAELYAQVLAHSGADISDKRPTGTYSALIDAVQSDHAEFFPAYTGSLLEDLTPDRSAGGPTQIYVDLNRAIPQGLSVGDPTPVTNDSVLVVPAAVGDITDLADCSRLPTGLALIATRPLSESDRQTLAGAQCAVRQPAATVSPQELAERVRDGGAVGVVSRLAAANIRDRGVRVVGGTTDVSDTDTGTRPASSKPTFRGENLVPVFATGALDRRQVTAVNKVAGELSTADLAEMMRKVGGGSTPTAEVAAWRAEHDL